jgi:hypothetical protein
VIPFRFLFRSRLLGLEQYALCEASYVVVRMLQHYDRIDSAVPNPQIKNAITLSLFPGDGVKVKMHRAST